MKDIIYLDNSATTPVRPEVVLAMKPYWNREFGNPGSITKGGVRAKQAVLDSRQKIAECLLARPQEIIFTSGGTESNNLAIFGSVKNIRNSHFITTNIEHSSITECFKELESRGAEVDYLAVKPNGIIDLKDLRKKIKANTVLVSIGYVNGEIGVIQPIKEIAKEIRHARKIHQGGTLNPQKGSTLEKNIFPFFHTDASQAGLYCNLNVNELGVDMMTLDAQKIFGPKGVGILYKKTTVEISPIIFGGGQEAGLRSGTENVPLIVGMAKAIELTRGSGHPSLDKEGKGAVEKMEKLRDYFWQKIQKEIPTAILNGDIENRVPNNLNISIPNIDSEFTVLCLDEAGIVCSTRSACSHDEDGSSVVFAISQDRAHAKSTLRFSLGEDITRADINYVVSTLKNILNKYLLISK